MAAIQQLTNFLCRISSDLHPRAAPDSRQSSVYDDLELDCVFAVFPCKQWHHAQERFSPQSEQFITFEGNGGRAEAIVAEDIFLGARDRQPHGVAGFGERQGL